LGRADIPIVPVVIGDPHAATAAEHLMLDAGYLVQAAKPPVVPHGTSRLRFCVSALHCEAELDGASAALFESLARLG
jgi:8-amino-7-oxononanoate synthase